MNYNETYFQKNVPVTEPKPGREKEMKKNLAGGYAFKADDFTALRRWLLTGSMTNAYYQNSREMTTDNLGTLIKCVNGNPKKTAEEILYASNKGINNHTPILALVYLSNGNFAAKAEFRALFNQVIRTASHLYEFMSYVKSVRGMGKTIHKAVLNWIDSKSLNEKEYQFLKYQNRNGWTGRDVFRTVKPVTTMPETDILYAWITGNESKANVQALAESGLMRVEAYERLKMGVSEAEVIQIIHDFNMTQEMIPANIERTGAVWHALFQKMPITASLRNLGNLTDKAIFRTKENLDLLEKRFEKENIKRGRLHPLTIANGYQTYMQGHGMKGSLTWKPISRINDILDQAVNDAFEVIEPTGKSFFHALDISGSMSWGGYSGIGFGIGNLALDPMQVAGIMALATVKAEKDYFVGGFSHYFIELPKLNKRTSFQDVITGRHVAGLSFGGTNASLAYKYATKEKMPVDIFVNWTDNMSWLGDHPTDALADYRSKVNPEARAVYVTLATYGDNITLVDPKDNRSYDIAGFSSETPKLIQLFAEGAL